MTDKIKKMLEQLKSKEYKKLRNKGEIFRIERLASPEEYFELYKKLSYTDNYLIFEHDIPTWPDARDTA